MKVKIPTGYSKGSMDPKDLARLMKEMGFETVETRNSDSLDFRDVAVWSARQALENAYNLGKLDMSETVAKATMPKMPMTKTRKG